MIEGDNIGRIVVFELNEQTSDFFDDLIKMAKQHSESELEIDLMHHKVYCGNQEVGLTIKEYTLLCLLAVNEGCVLTYDQIYQRVWGEEAFGSTNNAIKCHIRNLREKLREANPDARFSIRCVREVGYCFDVNADGKVIT